MNFIQKTKSIRYGMEFTHGIRRALMSALALIYFISLGFSVISITTLFAISGIIMLLFEFPTGAIADYDSRKKSLIISFFLFFIAFLGIFLFKNFWLLAGSWILGDIAWTFSTGASSAWVIDALKYAKKKSKIVSLISKGYIFEKSGYFIGGLLGLIIVAINFRFIWLLISLTNLLMMIIIWGYMEERNFKPEKVQYNYLMKSFIKAKESFSYVIHKKNKELRALMLGGIFAAIAIGSFFTAVPLFFAQILNLRPEYISGIYSLSVLFAIVGPFLAEKIAHKKGFRISFFTFFMIMSLAIIVFAFSKSLILAIVSLTILRIALASNDVIEDSAYQHEFDSKIRASLGSLNSFNWNIANSIGIFLTGIAISIFGVSHTLILSGVLTFLTGLIYFFGMKK